MFHIDVKVSSNSLRERRFTGFYGLPEVTQRVHSWTLFCQIAGMTDLSWLCKGDFNEILYDSEKLGGVNKRWRLMADFREALKDCNLEDMWFSGPKFTWSNKREGNGMIIEKLDMDLCNKA